MTATQSMERFFVTVTAPDGSSDEVWLEISDQALPLDVLQAIADLTTPLTADSSLARLTFEVDQREAPCPECRTGEVVAVGREERETGHQPYACNAGCGYRG